MCVVPAHDSNHRYNASLTMDNYYAALVNHDLYGQPKVDKKQGL